MAEKSKIEWTDATWNPVRGCTRVSEGCRNCYAEILAARFSKPGQWGHGFAQLVGARDHDHRWSGKVELIETQLSLPLRWKKPRKIFVNSTSDLFHDALSDEAIDRVFAVMALCPQHTFQVLTKRPARLQRYFAFRDRDRAIDAHIVAMIGDDAAWKASPFGGCQPPFPRPNVWLGVSVEDQPTASERIPHLLHTPAAVRFISAEPLLDSLDLSRWLAVERITLSGKPHWTERTGQVSSLDLVICGGESGHGARPMHPDWARSLRDQCAAAGVSFFFKQWGEWRHAPDRAHLKELLREPWMRVESRNISDRHAFMVREGKKHAGRLLDGREHNALPNPTKEFAA